MIERNNNAREYLAQGVNLIADIVKETLGPDGKNVVLFENDKAFMTKDGISIAQRVYSNNHAIEAGIQLAREASAKTAKQAGDGSTTSLILTQAFFNKGIKMLDNGVNLNSVKAELDSVVTIARNTLDKIKKEASFDESTIHKVATVSANNDEEIGKLVTEAFINSGEDGTITFEMDDVATSYVETIEGSRYALAIAAKEFYNNEGRQEACYDNPIILLLGTEIKNINIIKPALQHAINNHKALVIFATDFSPLALTQMYRNYAAGVVNIVPIKVQGYSGNRTDILHDLSALTGGDVYDIVPTQSVPRYGTCDKIVSTLSGTTILKRETSENYEIRINNLKEMISLEKDDTIRGIMERRLTQLKGKISIIHVGGKTEAETKERYDRVEDAVCAVKSALAEGICVGGGYTYYKIGENLEDNAFESCLYEPFNQLKKNCAVEFLRPESHMYYNFLTNTFESVSDPNVIDPVKVVRLSIENAVAAAKMLLTTESIIYVE